MRASGYALIEAVLVIIILGILAVFIAPILSATVSSYDTVSRNAEVLAKTRYAMERMAREIRNMRRDPKNSARGDISTMTASKFEFCSGDGTRVTLDAGAVPGEVRIGYTAGSLLTTCASGAVTTNRLTDLVQSANIFQYCKNDGVTCATSSGATVDELSVAFIDITMTLTGTGTNPYTSTQRVDLRNP
ncbi:MAG TPA: type II secretion system protein [Burkholderiales bacterium]|nr:type II secretion system protein [Burkholderiales bacterium]